MQAGANATTTDSSSIAESQVNSLIEIKVLLNTLINYQSMMLDRAFGGSPVSAEKDQGLPTGPGIIGATVSHLHELRKNAELALDNQKKLERII